MGLIESASTVYAKAYLTELGRKYLFNEDGSRIQNINGVDIDLFKITKFSLGDPDVNYRINNLLESGDVPDLSGEGVASDCSVKGAKGRDLNNIVFPTQTAFFDETAELTYGSAPSNVSIEVNLQNTNQQIDASYKFDLRTFIDGAEVNGEPYNVTPKNYGNINLDNGKLIITLKEPVGQTTLAGSTTSVSDGYRLVITYPSATTSKTEMLISFEIGTIQGTAANGGAAGGAAGGTGAVGSGGASGAGGAGSTVNVIWTPMTQFDEDLKNAVVDFIDTEKNGNKLSFDDKNGRTKTLPFTFFSETYKQLGSGEVGSFDLILKYPPTSVGSGGISTN